MRREKWLSEQYLQGASIKKLNIKHWPFVVLTDRGGLNKRFHITTSQGYNYNNAIWCVRAIKRYISVWGDFISKQLSSNMAEMNRHYISEAS